MKDNATKAEKSSESSYSEQEQSVHSDNLIQKDSSEDKSHEIPFIITNLEDLETNVETVSKETEDSTDYKQNSSQLQDKYDCSESDEDIINKNQYPCTHDTVKSNNHIDETKSSRKSNKRVLIAVIIILLLPLIAYGGRFYTQFKEFEHQEKLDFAVLCKENYNIKDYENFLSKYPQSEHRREAKARLSELISLAKSWELIKNSQNENDFVNFKNQYNDDYYYRLCDLKLDSIDWATATKANTPDSYQTYINRHPTGIYLSDAIIAKGEVGYMNLSDKEHNTLRNICNYFFNALGQNNTDTISCFLSQEVETFMGLQTPSQEDISKWIAENQQQVSFMSYIIKDEIKCQKETDIEKDTHNYISAFNLEKITTDEKGRETIKPIKAIIKQNKDFQIYSIEIQYI